MPRVQIVTDSSAHFKDPDFPDQHRVTVVPLTIQFGDRRYHEGEDIDTWKFMDLVSSGAPFPVTEAPSVEQFAAVYEALNRSTDQILSIHLSSKLGHTWRNAKTASENLLGRCTVISIDSLTTSVGLGLMVETAVQAAEAGASLDEVVRRVRGMIPRLYAIFFVESLDYLEKSGRVGSAQAILGTMLGIKPFLTLEEGDLVPMEKVRNRVQAIEKLSEFVAEFSDIEHLALLQMTTAHTEDTRQLIERLAADFPARRFDIVPYPTSLATFLGPNGMGVMVLEGKGEAE